MFHSYYTTTSIMQSEESNKYANSLIMLIDVRDHETFGDMLAIYGLPSNLCKDLNRVIREAIKVEIIFVTLIREAYINLMKDYRFLDRYLAYFAARAGRMDILEWLARYSKFLTHGVCIALIDSYQIDNFYYAHKLGYPCDEETMLEAAKCGRMEVIYYLYKRQVPWHKDTTLVLTEFDHLDCLEFAIDHGCPIHPDTITKAVQFDRVEIFKFLMSYQCPLAKVLG